MPEETELSVVIESVSVQLIFAEALPFLAAKLVIAPGLYLSSYPATMEVTTLLNAP
jgi:hypothetical protein